MSETTKENKMEDTKQKARVKFDEATGCYLLILDGVLLGAIRSFEERTTQMSGRLAVGYSYRTRWNASRGGKRVGFGSFRTRKDAVEYLLNHREEA
jgi:hypothetical protein